MTREYNVEKVNDGEVIWYEENGFRVSFMANKENSEYQEYLKSLDEASTL